MTACLAFFQATTGGCTSEGTLAVDQVTKVELHRKYKCVCTCVYVWVKRCAFVHSVRTVFKHKVHRCSIT